MAEEAKLFHNQNISRQEDFSKETLKNFNEEETEEEENGIELGLGLSMNGIFGVDPRAKRLCRSSSVSDFTNPTRENGFTLPVTSAVSNVNLVRSCSLPVETEEEWRRKKELQTLRRMEAKRKRSEKKKNLRVMKGSNLQNSQNFHSQQQRQEQFVKNEFLGGDVQGQGGVLSPPPALVATQVSQGSGLSFGVSDESQPCNKGVTKGAESRSSSSVQSFSDRKQKSVLPGSTSTERRGTASATAIKDAGASKSTVTENGAMEVVRNVLEDMPCVFTKGDGPNGKRIEGFLYKYGSGEEVRIVCVCHGSFLSPAEFVKHAGGSDVEHPLRHIVVNSSQFL